jgi:hypothetical protein
MRSQLKMNRDETAFTRWRVPRNISAISTRYFLHVPFQNFTWCSPYFRNYKMTCACPNLSNDISAISTWYFLRNSTKTLSLHLLYIINCPNERKVPFWTLPISKHIYLHCNEPIGSIKTKNLWKGTKYGWIIDFPKHHHESTHTPLDPFLSLLFPFPSPFTHFAFLGVLRTFPANIANFFSFLQVC